MAVVNLDTLSNFSKSDTSVYSQLSTCPDCVKHFTYKIEKTKFLEEKVNELELMMNVQLEDALEWLGLHPYLEDC